MNTFVHKTFYMVLFALLSTGLYAQTVNPVKNLTGSCNSNGKVTLTWSEPDFSGDGFWLAYSVNSIMGQLGLEGSGEIRSAARFQPADLAAKGVTAGDKVALLQMALPKIGCSNLVAQIYSGELELFGILIPTKALDQPIDINSVNEGAWNTIKLNTPHTINMSSALWFGYSVNYDSEQGAMPLAYAAQEWVEKKSDLIWSKSSLGVGLWSDLYTASQNQYQLAACVKAFITKSDVVPLLQKYYVYQDGVKIGETTNKNFSKEGVGVGAHEFCVVAVYDTGAESEKICKTVTCNETCNVPTALTVAYSDECNQATLAWNPPASGNTLGYNVYRDGTLIAEAITETTYIDNDFVNTEAHTWNVRTVCETTTSNQVSKSLPVCYNNINEHLKNLSIFPNPASQEVNIQVDDFQKVEIYNTFGQLIKSQNSNVVDVSTYSSGIYFFKVFDQEHNFMNKRVAVMK